MSINNQLQQLQEKICDFKSILNNIDNDNNLNSIAQIINDMGEIILQLLSMNTTQAHYKIKYNRLISKNLKLQLLTVNLTYLTKQEEENLISINSHISEIMQNIATEIKNIQYDKYSYATNTDQLQQYVEKQLTKKLTLAKSIKQQTDQQFVSQQQRYQEIHQFMKDNNGNNFLTKLKLEDNQLDQFDTLSHTLNQNQQQDAQQLQLSLLLLQKEQQALINHKQYLNDQIAIINRNENQQKGTINKLKCLVSNVSQIFSELQANQKQIIFLQEQLENNKENHLFIDKCSSILQKSIDCVDNI